MVPRWTLSTLTLIINLHGENQSEPTLTHLLLSHHSHHFARLNLNRSRIDEDNDRTTGKHPSMSYAYLFKYIIIGDTGEFLCSAFAEAGGRAAIEFVH